MSLPHNFNPLASDPSEFVSTGSYYVLKPKQKGKDGNLIYLPVVDNVSQSFAHAWTIGDNLARGAIESLSGAASTFGKALTTATVVAAQQNYGGGLHASACALFADSSPPTLNITTRIFSPDGNGNILKLCEKLKNLTSASLSGGSDIAKDAFGDNVSKLQNFAKEKLGRYGKVGVIQVPHWFDIEVVSFGGGGETVITAMKDMICNSMSTTFISPYVTNKNGKSEPSIVEINMSFGHAYKGFSENFAYGKRLNGGAA